MKRMLSIAWVLLLCGCNPNEVSPSQSDSSPTEGAAYARQPANYAWPAAADDVVLAPNLLAANYYVIFDGSGSMLDSACSGSGRKIDVAKASVEEFVELIPADANIGLYVFDRAGRREVAAFGTARDQIIQEVSSISAGGGTPLGEAVRAARAALTRQAQRQLGYGDYNMVVITDGEAQSIEDLKSAVGSVLKQTPVIIHTLGFCIGSGHSLNMAGKTLYHAANSVQELKSGLKSVLAEVPDYAATRFEQTPQ
jgi:Ca-activated chloride channel homolog